MIWPEDPLDQWINQPLILIELKIDENPLQNPSPKKVNRASALLPHNFPTMRMRSARILEATRRWNPTEGWSVSMSGRMKLTVRYSVERISVSDLGLDHVSGLLRLCEIGNSWIFSQLNLYMKLKLHEKLANYGFNT